MVGDTNIAASAEARNLGVSIDHQLTMKTQIKNICRSSMAAIRKIGQIRMYLDTKTTKKLVHAFVISRLDSCNSLLSCLPDSENNKLQRIQNTVTRMIEQSRRSDHISPILLRLHWLPVKKRIDFKVLLLTYKILHGKAPSYLCEIIHPYVPARTLRSQQQSLLQVPRTHTQFYGERSLSYYGPTLWNNLPLNTRNAPTVDSFKSLLKTFMFIQKSVIIYMLVYVK